jgi:hypothetical protein
MMNTAPLRSAADHPTKTLRVSVGTAVTTPNLRFTQLWGPRHLPQTFVSLSFGDPDIYPKPSFHSALGTPASTPNLRFTQLWGPR